MAADPGFAGAPAAGPGLTTATTTGQRPATLAAIAGRRDNALMALTPAERQARRRARIKAGETVPTCSSCGAKLQPDLRKRDDRQGVGLCWGCWIKTPAGQESERKRGERTRVADPERARELAKARAWRFRQRILDRARSRGAI